jgi:hypothetical protein
MKKQDCNKQPQVFLAEVKKVGVSSCHTEPEFDTPFYDTTLPNRFIAIPAEDENFFVEVPVASRWSIGQWLRIDGVGKYPIMNVMGDHILVLKNTGGINGNPATGDQFLGTRKLWLTEEETTFVNLNLASVQEALEDPDFEPCLMLDETKAAQVGHPVGAINVAASCAPCGTNNKATKIKRCLAVFVNIVFKLYTIGLPKLRELSVNAVTFKQNGEDVTRSVQDLVWNPSTGDLARRKLPTLNSVDAYVGGNKIYVSVPPDYANSFYILSTNQQTGAPAWINFDFKSSHRIGNSLAAGTHNVKTLIEGALNIQLPSVGEIDLGVSATTIQAAPGVSVAQVNATVNGQTVASTLNQDNIGNGYKVIAVNLSAPSLVFANGTFVLEVAHIPFSYYN